MPCPSCLRLVILSGTSVMFGIQSKTWHVHAGPCFAMLLDVTNSKQPKTGGEYKYVTDAVAQRLASCYRDGLPLSSYLSAQLIDAIYKLDRSNDGAYVTAAADMQHAMYTWSHGSSPETR